MPVDTFAEAFNHTTFRTSVLTDTRNFAWKLLLLGVAIACALAIPDPALQAATIFAAVLVLAFLLLKRIGDPAN